MDEQTARSVAAQLRKPHGEWAERIATFMEHGNKLLIERSIAALGIEEGDHVLEIGMGNAAHIKSIIGIESLRYTGYDYSKDMIQLAKGLNEKHMSDNVAQFVCGDACSMPFEDDSFDKVLTVNTVYFWDDIKKICSEIKRVLKPEGRLVLGLRPEKLMSTYPMTRYGFVLYSAESVCRMLSENGFEIIAAEEETEPEQEIDGEKMQLASLIVVARV